MGDGMKATGRRAERETLLKTNSSRNLTLFVDETVSRKLEANGWQYNFEYSTSYVTKP